MAARSSMIGEQALDGVRHSRTRPPAGQPTPCCSVGATSAPDVYLSHTCALHSVALQGSSTHYAPARPYCAECDGFVEDATWNPPTRRGFGSSMPPRLSKHMGGWTAWGQGVGGKGGGPREDAAETQDITAAAARRRRLADMVLLVPARNPDRRLSSALVPHVAEICLGWSQ